MKGNTSKSIATYNAIKSAGIDLISRHGYEAVTLRQLGQAAGIEAGSLYYYINSKQDLLFRILKETLDEDFAELKSKLKAVESPASRLVTFIEWFVRGIIAKKQTCFLWTSEIRSLSPDNYRVISKKSRLFVDCLEDIIRRGTAAGLYRESDIEGTVFAIWGLLSSPLMWLYPEQGTDVDKIVALLTRLSFRCLGVETAPAVNVSAKSKFGTVTSVARAGRKRHI
ncbi:MAG: TetR/AcrR family transcriptional regulator [Candidatus Binataceae bacterium]